MAISKNTQHYTVCRLFFAYQRNLLDLLHGQEPGLRMPALSQGFAYIYHTPGRITLSASAGEEAAGTVYEYRLRTFLPGDFLELSEKLAAMVRLPQVVMLELEDGKRAMMGGPGQGARMGYEQSLDARGAEISWGYKSARHIYQVGWLYQFGLNDQGELVQYYQDGSTYNLSGQGVFTGIGQAASDKYRDQENLVSG